MATICDACGTKFGRDDGHANLHVSPPRPDLKLFRELAATGQSYDPPDPLALDLCLSCTSKALAHLGLPTQVCDLPKIQTADAEPPPTGALTEADLRELGITPPISTDQQKA